MLTFSKGDVIPPTLMVVHSTMSQASHHELDGETNQIRKPPAELTVSEEEVPGSSNEIDNLISDIKGKLTRDFH